MRQFVMLICMGMLYSCSYGKETTRGGSAGMGNKANGAGSLTAVIEAPVVLTPQQKLKNSYRIAVLRKIDDSKTGKREYYIYDDSGWLDIWYGGDKLITFRDKVNKQELVEEYGFIESKLPDYREAVTLLRAVQLSKDGITLRVIDDPERSNANWISYIEIDSPDYRIADEFYVGMPVEDFKAISAIDYVDDELLMICLGCGRLEYVFDYNSGSSDLYFLVHYLLIKFEEEEIKNFTYYIGEETNSP